MNKKRIIVVILLAIYGVSTFVSYVVFNKIQSRTSNDSSTIADPTPLTPQETADKRSRVDPSEPKTEVCPLNGAMYTKTEKEIWETRRPLGVMIENHSDSRPQSGLESADIVYEAVAEGGITRFLALFYCGASASDVEVGPVRSARTYFLDWISEYGTYPLYAHVGGANCNTVTGDGCQNGKKADAIGQIQKYGWNLYSDMNQMIGVDLGVKVFRRDNRLEKFTGRDDIAYEHTMYSSTDKLWNVAANRGIGFIDDKTNKGWDDAFVSWQFKDEQLIDGVPANAINYSFWEQSANQYSANWLFDTSTNSYLRSTGSQEHIDLESKQQLNANTIILAIMKESRANDGYPGNLHLLYENKGKGQAYIFMDGKKIDGQWSKKDRTSRMIFIDSRGKEIPLSRGKIWISIIPATNIDNVIFQ